MCGDGVEVWGGDEGDEGVVSRGGGSIGGVRVAGRGGMELGGICAASEHDGWGIAGGGGDAGGRAGGEGGVDAVCAGEDEGDGRVSAGDVCVGEEGGGE